MLMLLGTTSNPPSSCRSVRVLYNFSQLYAMIWSIGLL